MLQTLRVLRAAVALHEFTVEDLADLAGVPEAQAHRALQDHPDDFTPVGSQAGGRTIYRATPASTDNVAQLLQQHEDLVDTTDEVAADLPTSDERLAAAEHLLLTTPEYPEDRRIRRADLALDTIRRVEASALDDPTVAARCNAAELLASTIREDWASQSTISVERLRRQWEKALHDLVAAGLQGFARRIVDRLNQSPSGDLLAVSVPEVAATGTAGEGLDGPVLLVVLAERVEDAAITLALELLERQWKRNRFRELTSGHIRRLLGGTAPQAVEVLQQELSHVPEWEWRPAVAAVLDSLTAVTPIVLTDALAVELRPDRLEAHVRERTGHVRRAASLSDTQEAIYDRVLSATCEQILRALAGVSGFERYVPVVGHQYVRDMRQAPADISVRQHGYELSADEFERRYLDHVEGTIGDLELFGVGRGRLPRTRPFERAYVEPVVARVSQVLPDEDDDAELTGAGVDVVSGLRDHRRVLLLGGAGAGKTTMLRWLAASCGQDRPSEHLWGNVVPFFVPLRQFAHEPLPTVEQLPAVVAEAIAAEAPPGWVSAQFRAGRALLLLDGVDELEPHRRRELRAWLGQMVTAYGDARFVVSARPFAVPEDWLASSGFVTFDLLPLSWGGIEMFVGAWHEAAADEQPSNPDVQDWLGEGRQRLLALLNTRVELRRLAGNPLMCGMLCALHQDREMHLPHDRKGLFDAMLDLLLVRWDEARGVQVDEWPPLSKEEQIVLLQRFAYSMVKNHEVVVPRADAAGRIGHAMRGLRSQDLGADVVLQRMLERTGLLREPAPDQVQFVGRSVRDYLAAKEVVDSGEFGFLVEQAHLDHWYDVVVHAVANARPREREWVLRRLLDGNAAAKDSPRLRSRLHLVAAACLPHADVLDEDVRALVEQAAERLIPPASLDEAEVLARAAPFVLDLLPGPEGLTPHEAASVVRTAAMIGGEGVWEKLTEFVTLGESTVIDELLRAWRRWDDPESYARTVLADVDFGDRRVEVRGWHRIRCLPHLKHLTNVACYGDFGDLGPLAAVPSLRRLELIQNESIRDLLPLAGSPTLGTLVLRTGCQFLRDLSPLARTRIDDLTLHLVKANLGTLEGVGLRGLTIRDERLSVGLDPLPEDLPLRELVVDNLPRYRNLRGVERWQQLEHVSVWGVPQADEIEALTALPTLRRLTIRRAESTDDLARLGVLPALRKLDLYDVVASTEAVAAAMRDRPDVEVRVEGRLRASRRRVG